MTKENFIEIFNKLIEIQTKEDEFYDKVDEFFGGGTFEYFAEHTYFSFMLTILSKSFPNPKAVEEELDFFFYECETSFLEYYNSTVVDRIVNDIEIPASNVEEFYEYLISL